MRMSAKQNGVTAIMAVVVGFVGFVGVLVVLAQRKLGIYCKRQYFAAAEGGAALAPAAAAGRASCVHPFLAAA